MRNTVKEGQICRGPCLKSGFKPYYQCATEPWAYDGSYYQWNLCSPDTDEHLYTAHGFACKDPKGCKVDNSEDKFSFCEINPDENHFGNDVDSLLCNGDCGKTKVTKDYCSIPVSKDDKPAASTTEGASGPTKASTKDSSTEKTTKGGTEENTTTKGKPTTRGNRFFFVLISQKKTLYYREQMMFNNMQTTRFRIFSLFVRVTV